MVYCPRLESDAVQRTWAQGFKSSHFRHFYAPVAQLDQSTCLRSKGAQVRILPGAPPHFSSIAQLVEHRTVNAAVAGSIPARGAMFSVIRQVACRLLWEQDVGCSIHPSRTIFGGLTERPKVADCKSARNCTLVRIQQPPPIWATDLPGRRQVISASSTRCCAVKTHRCPISISWGCSSVGERLLCKQ